MNISLFEIFIIFCKIGIQLLGGGYVIIPLLKKYLVEDKQIITEEELIDYFAMSQCIPGIIAGNISVLVGYKMRKLLGALMAVLGIIAPAFISILLIANFISFIIDSKYVAYAFWGIRISVIVLIIMTIKEMWEKSVNSIFSYILYFIIVLLLLFIRISPAIVIILSAIAGILYSLKGANKNV